MRGYHRQPEATAEVLAEGWLATGDVGELDGTGCGSPTARGPHQDVRRQVHRPATIEILFKAVCPLASQMVVHAEGRNYATALITLDSEALARWAAASGFPGGLRGPGRAAGGPRYVQASMDQVNARLNRWETIRTSGSSTAT